jgi:hypothetical protein
MKAAFTNAFANIVGLIGLFLAFVFPIGYIVFTEPVARVVSRIAWWIGLDRNAEPGDSLVDSAFLISFFLAVTGLCLANAFINRRKRKPPHVE